MGRQHYIARSGFVAQRGFTLIELLIVVVIVVLLAAAAGPSFSSALQRNRARTLAQDVASTVLAARSLAIANNLAYQVAITPSGAAPGGSLVVTQGINSLCAPATFVAGAGGTPLVMKTVNYATSTKYVGLTAQQPAGQTLCITPDGAARQVANGFMTSFYVGAAYFDNGNNPMHRYVVWVPANGVARLEQCVNLPDADARTLFGC